jgi:TonB family protein
MSMRRAMTTLARTSLACAALAAAAAHARAQTAAQWVTFSPASEGFRARMPKEPEVSGLRVTANGIDALGFGYYAAADERTRFVVWSMKGSSAAGPLGVGVPAGAFHTGGTPYLDAVDELAWELIVTPELRRLAGEKVSPRRMAEMDLGMAYRGEFVLSGLPARQFSVGLEKERGLVYVTAEGPQVYVVAALGADAEDPRLKLFLDSFALNSAPPSPKLGDGDARGGIGVGTGAGTGTGGGIGPGFGPGRGGNDGGAGGGGGDAPVDYSRTFKSIEVTKRAVITAKPEPGFTEQARKFNVTGTVRLRAVLSSTGEVRNVSVVKSLPHGLTAKAVNAAIQIRFVPAEKDGHRVSQYVLLEYNFNIY